jgi:colicin import membrane protein
VSVLDERSDFWRGLGFALLLHLLCLLLMLGGLWWTKSERPLSVAGSPIEAVLVEYLPPAASAPTPPRPAPQAPQETAPRPQPRPEPRPQQAEQQPQPQAQTEPQRPDTVDQERAARLAQQQATERAEREQRERRRQEQVLLEEKRKQEEAERRERLRKMEEERQAQLADIRRQREQAEAERRREEQRLQQLTDRRTQESERAEVARPNTPPAERLGNNGVSDDLRGRYQLAIQQAVTSAWLRPESTRAGVQCRIRIVQIPGGEVISASIVSPCNADELTRGSIERAVMRAQPLPYRGYESVFSREITFTFRYDGD